MLVADTSALISLAIAGQLDTVLAEFDVHTTEHVLEEITDTADYDNRHGRAADTVLDTCHRLTVHHVADPVESSRVDPGEGSCAVLTHEIEASFLLTDDLRALPELQTVADAQVAISPIVLKALVKRDAMDREAAVETLAELATQRDWLGAPIYHRAKALFD
jgi:predicted nucleic acid-binding protein